MNTTSREEKNLAGFTLVDETGKVARRFYHLELRLINSDFDQIFGSLLFEKFSSVSPIRRSISSMGVLQWCNFCWFEFQD